MNGLYPLLLKPEFSARIWGGSRLPGLPAVSLSGDPFGESWQVYGGNLISNGTLSGQTLQQAASAAGSELLGTASVARYGTQVPLLAKLIDAQLPLSVQVHPDDAYARANEAASGHLGKAEAWVILHAGPGATIIRGFQRDVSAKEARQAALSGTLPEFLNLIPVRGGDVIYNPPGMVHAIGADITLYEIQQSSDLTYRLYDYDRRDNAGQLRELHLEQALAVADLTKSGTKLLAAQPLSAGRSELVRCEFFVLERIVVDGTKKLTTTAASLELLTCVDGSLKLSSEAGSAPLESSASIVLPASLGSYRVAGSGIFMRSFLPPEKG